MILILGLGNPGKEYENTPHNLGRSFLSRFASEQAFSDFTAEKKFNALISEGNLGGKKIIAGLPETFMNNSGEAVSAIAQFYKIPPEGIWILHDEADLPLGHVRIVLDRGPAGHNGVKSVAEKLGTNSFWRFRIGIAPAEPSPLPLDAYVLRKDAIGEAERNAIFEKVKKLLLTAVERGIKNAGSAAD